MRQRLCGRTWEAEAIGDGRLDPTARASFERHAATCASCSNELQALARIGDAMRELPEYASQAIDRRRGRAALVHRANELLMRGHHRAWRAWTFASLAAGALVLTVLGARWPGAGFGSEVASPHFEVDDVAHATWTTAVAAGTARVALSDGAAAVHVEHLAQGQRFFVDLPDGDLEVRGTRFQVRVADRRTKHVEVKEGVVAIRLVGHPEIVLVAGQQWAAPEQAEPASMVASSTLSPQAVALPFPPVVAAVPVQRRPAAGAPQSPPTGDDAAAPAGDVSARGGDAFAACIGAFESSDYAGADHLLANFIRDSPSDARAEDAAFLRALAHARMGDAAGAARPARDYLQRYPQALRRKEATRLAASVDLPRAP